MIDHYYSNLESRQRLRRSPLGIYIDPFAALLAKEGYSKTTGQNKLRLVADLSRWLDRKDIQPQSLDERHIADYFDARWRRRKRTRSDRAHVTLLLRHLRQIGVISIPAKPTAKGPVDLLENAYANFLLQERGLTQATVDNYGHEIRRFLLHRFETKKLWLDDLSIKDITAFILREGPRTPGRLQVRTTALRSFLRFLEQQGRVRPNLASSVPAIVNGRWTELPKFLEPEQVKRLLKSCDRHSVIGRRDYAVLLLLAKLGLRACEVVQLNLDDINWQTGELLIHGKGSRRDCLPLPDDVGKALVNYLRQGRPTCSCRRVFIRTKAPRQGFSGSDGIRNIVVRALSRAEIHPPIKGAHLLRHSLATQMLRGGASLMQIGQILRHAQVQTTEIYAKVDLTALRALAQPWPGVDRCAR